MAQKGWGGLPWDVVPMCGVDGGSWAHLSFSPEKGQPGRVPGP